MFLAFDFAVMLFNFLWYSTLKQTFAFKDADLCFYIINTYFKTLMDVVAFANLRLICLVMPAWRCATLMNILSYNVLDNSRVTPYAFLCPLELRLQ